MTIAEIARTRRDLPSPAMRRAIREDAGVSQAMIGRDLGVSRQAVCRWEAGTRNPRGELAGAYARLLRELQEVGGP
jgi:DNA-binding XRE family transcriptional regulator